MGKLEKYKPAAEKNLLVLMAGIVWVGVGIMLLVLAFSWLEADADSNIYLFGGVGLVLALLVHNFGFLRIVDKNLKRIIPMKGKKCVFSFITWKSYLLIIVMMTMGIMLRHSFIPRPYLAIIYTAIGLALILSSFRYMRVFIREMKR
jgi:membrane protease YdiL (CAAX protease family)